MFSGNSMMVTKFVLSRCRQGWVAHGWEECPSCKTTIKKDRAKFSLSGAPGPHVLLDLDEIPCLRNKRRCDFLFIADNTKTNSEWVVPIECTSGGRKELKTILQQLRAGAALIENYIPNSARMRFQPILVGKVGRVRRYRKDGKMDVRFHGKPVPLEVVENNDTIASKLSV